MTMVYGVDAGGLEFVQLARKVAAEVVAPHAAEVDASGRFPRESIDALGKAGLMGLTIPADAGGKGQGPAVFAAVVEELAQACASTAMIYVMHNAAVQTLVASTTLADRQAILRDAAAGRHLTTLALSELGTRSNFWIPMSELAERGDGAVVSASKSWVTSASHCDSFVSGSRKPGAQSPIEQTLYLVRRPRPGVTPKAAGFDGLGLRGNDSAPVAVEGYELRGGDLLTRHGDGLNMTLGVVLPWFAVGTSAMANGLCLAAVGATITHLTAAGFAHDGSKLRDLPNLRARVAEMHSKTEQSRALLGHTLARLAAPTDETPLYVLHARYAAINAAVEVTDLAMRACGGAAFRKELALERAFRDARAGWVMAPTSDALADFIGKALTGLPLV